MKQANRRTQFKSIALLLSFVFIFVISSCTVRNFVQQQMGIPVTKVHNFAKSGLNSASACFVSDYTKQLQLKTAQVDLIVAFIVVAFVLVIAFPARKLFFYHNPGKHFWKPIPFYLLYGKMKLLS